MKKRNRLYVNPDSRQLWLFIIAMLTLGLQVSSAEAQDMKIGSGIYFVNNVKVKTGSIVNQGILNNGSAGAINLTGNWQNNGSYTANTGSLVTFNGTSTQEIGGTNPTTFSNVTLNNGNGCSLASGVNVEGTLDFQSGKLTTGADTLKMGPSGTIVHADASKYINGKLAFTLDSTGSRVFPVGKGGVYRPVSFQYTGLTGTSIVTVEQMETALTGSLPVNTYLLATNRYWSIGQQGGSALQYFLTLDSTGTSPVNPVVLLKKDGAMVSSFPTTAPNYTNTTALSSFSDFALGEQCPLHIISGYAKYDNNPQTPINGLKIMLKQNDIAIDSVITASNGFYQFNNVNNGNYGLQVKSAHPSGQWQTWGGVNNTDYLLINKHIAGTTLIPSNPPVGQIAASVKVPHPLINNTDAEAVRQAAKFGWGSPAYFDIPKWVFSGVDQSSGIDAFSMNCANVTRDIFGLCSGDVNGTYVPPLGHKTAVETLHATSLQLVNEGTLAVTEEITFPIRIVETLHATSLQGQTIGAITLLMDYDPTQIEITGVSIPGSEIQPWFEVQGSILAIGWMSLDPIHLETDEPLLLVHARLTDVKCQVSGARCQISFALNDSPLSELADGDGNVLEGVKLAMPSGANGKTAKLQNGKMEIVSVYPNPAKDVVHLEISSEDETTVNIEIFNMPGKKVLQTESMTIIPGLNIKSMDVSMLPFGVYMMKVTMDERTEIRKVLVNR